MGSGRAQCFLPSSRNWVRQAGLGSVWLAVILPALGAGPAWGAGQGVWEWIGGPEAASVAAIAVDPSDPRIVYAGTEFSGLYKTVNGGVGWAPMNRGLPGITIPEVVINPHDPREVFAGSSDGLAGVYLSSDGGANWVWQPQGPLPAVFDAGDDTMFGFRGPVVFSSIDGGFTWMFAGRLPDGAIISSLARDSADPNVFYAASFFALYRSTDGGASFTLQATPDVLGPASVTVDAAAPGTVYLSTRAGIWKSVDSGASWSLAIRGLRGLRNHNREVQVFRVVATSPAILYAVLVDKSFRSELYRSTDGAATWVDQGFFGTGGGQSFSILAASAAAPDLLYAGDPFQVSGLFKSSNAGRSWTFVDHELASFLSGVTFQPGPRGGLYALGASTWKSTDGGTTWKDLKRPLSSLLVDPADPDRLDAIQAGGFTTSADGGRTWSKVQLPPACMELTEIVVAPSSPPVLYALTDNTTNACANHPGLSSTDGGRTWREIPELDNAIGLVVDPADPKTLYAARWTETDLIKSRDEGRSWTMVGPSLASLTGGRPLRLAIARSGELFLTLSDGAIFTSRDHGRSWQPAGPLPLPDFTLTRLIPDPYVVDRVFALGPRSLFRSDDGGRSWVSTGRGLTRSAFPQSVAVSPDGTLFVAANDGIFSLAPPPD
jgi:photosystem II stability/assembly factor-like uncharacterized protein